MGNSQTQSQKFNELHWRITNSANPQVETYENNNDKNVHIQRHIIGAANQQDFQRIKEFSYLRKNNPRWVSALYFELGDNHGDFCSPRFEAKLYLEKIIARLEQISNLSYSDALHLYDQALNGFQQFARIMGCFYVQSSYIGVNQAGVAKVWAGSSWPEITVKGGTVCEEDMVKSIVGCIENVIDWNAMPAEFPTIGRFLYRNYKRIHFDQAIKELRLCARITNLSTIPGRLSSVTYNERQIQRNQQPLEQTRSQVVNNGIPVMSSNPPRFSFMRNQQETQSNALRKVSSMSAIPVYQQPNAPFYANQPNKQVQVLERTLSHPQLIAGSRIRQQPSSFKQVASVPIKPQPFIQRMPIESQYFTYTQPVNFQPSSSLHNSNALQKATPITASESNKNLAQQNKQFSIVRQSQLVIHPPSQTQIPVNSSKESSVLPLQSFYKKSTVQTPTISKEQTQDYLRKYNDNSQSIILGLEKSQASVQNPAPSQSKYLSYLKSNNDYIQTTKKYAYISGMTTQLAPKTSKSPSSSLQHKYLTPSGINKKQLSNLNSIEEVQTEHYWKENSSKNSSAHKAEQTTSPYSLKTIKETNNFDNKPNKELAFNKNIANTIDENDGKSSDDFLKKLKEMSSVSFDFKFQPSKTSEYTSVKDYDFTSTNNDFGASKKEYNYTFDRKQSPKIQEAFDFQSKTKTNEYISVPETKPSKYLDYTSYIPSRFLSSNLDKYTSSLYKSQIDPQLLADLQKTKE